MSGEIIDSAITQNECMEKSELDSIGVRIENIVAGMEDLATLIGKVKKEPVKLNNGVTLIPGLGMVTEANMIRTKGKDLRNGIFKVLVLGTFKNGKSTLLNAILKEEILVAKAGPATAIITKVVYGNDEMVTIIGSDGSDRKESLAEFQDKYTLTVDDVETILKGNELQKEVVVDRFKNINYAQLERPNYLFKNGIQLIDSPGLEESRSRDLVTRTYFPQAQAIIFLLRVDQILNHEEREFISKNILNKNVTNVFFVVNRYDTLRKQTDRIEIESIVYKFLYPLYNNDELYNKRVFFVSALDALDACTEGHTDEKLLEKSNIPRFEKELEQYLTGEERVKAGFSTTVEAVDSVVDVAVRNINGEIGALNEPIEKLSANRKETEKLLVELENGLQSKKELISLYGEKISSKMISNLDSYVANMLTNWDTEAPQAMDLSEIGIGTAMLSAFKEGSKKKMEKIIEREMNKYLNTKFEEWQLSELPEVINPILNEMENKLDKELEDFNFQLIEIERIFSGKNISEGQTDEGKTTKAKKLIQAAGGLILLDPSQIGGSLMGDGSWTKFFGRFILDTIIAAISFSAFGPVGIVIYVLAEIWHTKHSHKDFGSKLMSSLGMKLREELPKRIKEKEPGISRDIEAKFKEIGNKLTAGLQAKINEVREEQDRIIGLIQTESSTADKEKERLMFIQDNITRVSENIKSYA